MGWYSNAPTANRIQNTNTLMTCAALLEMNQNVLQTVDNFSGDQIARGNRLSAQAFSIQGSSSNLGIQLQQAVGQLNSFRMEAGALNAELSENIEMFTQAIQQFNVPRAAREINVSGKKIARAAENATANSLTNLFILQANRRDSIAGVVAKIDQADAILNPLSNSSAANSIPDMQFVRG